MLMSKIPYTSEKSALKAKKKFLKELSKDKEAERIYQKELNLEMEILSYFDALKPENEEEIELDVLEKMTKEDEIDEIEMEKQTEPIVNAFEEKEADEDAEAARAIDAMETAESGDFEE